MSKDGTWKIWDIDGEFFILKIDFWLALKLLFTFAVYYVPLHLDPSIILYFVSIPQSVLLTNKIVTVKVWDRKCHKPFRLEENNALFLNVEVLGQGLAVVTKRDLSSVRTCIRLLGLQLKSLLLLSSSLFFLVSFNSS